MAISRLYLTVLHNDPTWKLFMLSRRPLSLQGKEIEMAQRSEMEQTPPTLQHQTCLVPASSACSGKEKCWKYISHVELFVLYYTVIFIFTAPGRNSGVWFCEVPYYKLCNFYIWQNRAILSMTCKKIILLDPLHLFLTLSSKKLPIFCHIKDWFYLGRWRPISVSQWKVSLKVFLNLCKHWVK